MEVRLMLTRVEMQRLANREKAALGVLEKDYVLTQVLNGLSQADELNKLLVFKGGTALRKIYFRDWRYSEDLDFSVKRDMPVAELQGHLKTWYARVKRETEITLTTNMIHKPNGYARLRIQFRGPLDYPGKIFMDLSFDEPICLEPSYLRIIADPFPDENRLILVYPIEELLAEKIRSLKERDKSRDYYDVWRILKEHAANINTHLAKDVLTRKLKHKGIKLKDSGDFFPADIKTIERYWDEDLSHQVNNLPPLENVLQELRKPLATFVK
jgi:predicted nucleotidyltransferase component of viral defense system